jgi:hypothetical protein
MKHHVAAKYTRTGRPVKIICPVHRKLTFGSRRAARRFIAQLPDKSQHEYRCPDCDGWHLTSQAQ